MNSSDLQLQFHADVMASKIGEAVKGDLDQLRDYVDAKAKGDDGVRKATPLNDKRVE